MQSAKLEVLQVLRGVAALLVVLLHFKEFLLPAFPLASEWLGYGYIGVDIFFVISGFIIYVSTANPEARYSRNFLFRRFCRVVLPAWAAMVLAILVQPPYLRDLILGGLFIPLKNIDPPFYGYSFLIVAWTLTYELIFYAIFALVLSTEVGRRFRGLITSAILLLLVSLAQSRACCSIDAQLAPLFVSGIANFPDQLVSLAGNPMLLEFIVGIFFGWVYLNRFVTARMAGWILLSSPIGLYVLGSTQFQSGHGLTRAGLLAAVIVIYALCYQVRRDVMHRESEMSLLGRARNFFVYLGEISYSLYLVHPSIKVGLIKLGVLLGIEQLSWGGFSSALLLTLLAAHFFYRWIELPSQRLGRHLSKRPSPMVALAG